ncbi:hypothetical protein ACHAW5_004983 [Stephanodiscus triporus]|uniref:Uncharacterized protein n=1 Tax=Stephanodiscus triporus TaxID=2934178 RepID=A0ABD3NNV4_9STRA
MQDEDTGSGRRQLRRLSLENIKSMLMNVITALVESDLEKEKGQKVVAVLINSILQTGGNNMSIRLRLTLSERCKGTCLEILKTTTLVTNAQRHLNGSDFIVTLQEEAGEMSDCDECQKIKNAKLTAIMKLSKAILSVTTPTKAPTKSLTKRDGKSLKTSKPTNSKSMKRKQPKTP